MKIEKENNIKETVISNEIIIFAINNLLEIKN